MNVIRILFFIILIAGMILFLFAPGVGTMAYVGAACCFIGLLGSIIFTIPQIKKLKSEIAQADEELKRVAEQYKNGKHK